MLSGQGLAFTGRDPFSPNDLARLLPSTTVQWIDGVPEGRGVDVVIIGQAGWSVDLLDLLILLEPAPRFLPQEGFLDELLFGYNWWVDYVAYLDAARSYYPGLQHVYVRSLESAPQIEWQWPSTEAVETTRGGDDGRDRAEIGELRARGYQITGLTTRDRWGILVGRCLPDLGLERVAYIIAGLVKNAKRQTNGRIRYQHAIEEWESDLARLKREFYVPEARTFRWPSTELR